MARRHLFGPVAEKFADQNLRQHIDAGDCLVFNHDGALAVGPFDTWETITARFPKGWQPDFLALHLQYNAIPPGLWQAPIPIVGLAGDWNLLWHHYRHVLPQCDLVLTDAPGVERLAKAGIMHALPAQLFGCEQAFVEWEYPAGPRDIDILFVGNFNPMVQPERLPWLGRIAKLKKRWNVHLTTGEFGDDYRKLLGRARIVFNRSIRGECNNRTFEAVAAGALLFQEAENQEVAQLLADDKECVFYTDGNLEELLDHYLEHEDERRKIAEYAQRRKHEFTFEAFWAESLKTVDSAWPRLQERAAKRREQSAPADFSGRAWQGASSTFGEDAALVADLNEALAKQPRSAVLNHTLGVALWCRAPSDPHRVANAFQAAWLSDPRHVVAGLNYAELLAIVNQKDNAIDQARRVLAMLDTLPTLPAEALDAVHVPAGFDTFRVEWERAAWQHAGDPVGEERAKRRVLHGRLHELLASLTDDLVHHLQQAEAQPDLPSSAGRVGIALARHNRPDEALSCLQRALALDPFNRDVRHAYHLMLSRLGRTADWLRFAAEQRLLADAAPKLVLAEPWFEELPSPAVMVVERPSETFRVVWHGAHSELHSLSLVNREICERLVERGHEVTLIEPPSPVSASQIAPLSAKLRERLAASLSGPADFHIAHQWPPSFTPPTEGHWVIMQPWEWGSIPRAWLAPMTQLIDEVWVPSNFVRNTFVGSGIPADQVHVIPNGVAPISFEKHEPLPLQTRKRFKFLFVGGTIQRKGIDLLLTAYEQCFSAQDDVCLVIKDSGVGSFYRGQTAEQQIAAIRAKPNAPEIEYHAEELSPSDMARLYAACDCLVHPYRGEGFGLPIAEALASALPVVVTGFGAALDFCREELAYLINATPETLDKGRGELETVREQFWAKPDLDHLRYLLRYVVEHPEEARAKAKLGQTYLQQHFTWEHTVAALESRLRQLRKQAIRRLQLPSASLPAPAHVSVNGKPRVSLTMIVKNEEHNLSDCLRSVADLVDEIVVADTGSTDRTKEIARQFGAKIVDFPWIDDFAAARNKALEHATGDWILWLDADDRLDEDNRRKLRDVFAHLPQDQLIGFVMNCRCIYGDKGEETVNHVRLFPNRASIRWKYRIHEQILGALKSQGGAVQFCDVVIEHLGYQDPEIHRKKGERNYRLLTIEHQENPDDPFVLFNLSTFLQEKRRYTEAIDMMQRSLSLSHPTDSIVRMLYHRIAQTQRLLGQKEAAVHTCAEGRIHYPNDAELLFEEGFLRHELRDLDGAIACFTYLLNNQDGNHYGGVNPAKRGYLARHMLGLCLRDAGRLQEAETQLHFALQEAPTHVATLAVVCELLLEQGRQSEVEPLLARLAAAPEGRLECLVLRSRQSFCRGDVATARTLLEQASREYPQAVYPRINLFRVLLNEGVDLVAAEKVLREILALDPNHTEAKHNLERLLHQAPGR